MFNRGFAVLLSVLVLSAATMARADGVDDVIALAQKGVGEDVMIASIEQSRSGYSLSAAEIIKLKDAKVPDKVITAMLRHKAARAVVAEAPIVVAPNAPALAPAPAEKMVIAPAAGFGILNIENLDDKIWSYSFEPNARTLWISTASADGRGNLGAHAGLSLRMPTGALKIRYNGLDIGPAVNIFAEDKSLLMLSRVDTAELEALYATVFERGERKSSDRLVTLRENAAPRTKRADVAEPAPEPRVVDRVEYVTPQPVVSYTTPVYYGDYYPYYGTSFYPAYYPRYYGGYPGYYGSHYYGGSSVNFGYSHVGHGSSFGIGVGFRH